MLLRAVNLMSVLYGSSPRPPRGWLPMPGMGLPGVPIAPPNLSIR